MRYRSERARRLWGTRHRPTTGSVSAQLGSQEIAWKGYSGRAVREECEWAGCTSPRLRELAETSRATAVDQFMTTVHHHAEGDTCASS